MTVGEMTPDQVLSYFAELERLADRGGVAVTTIAYGADSEQVADLRLPTGVDRPPIAILFHGGFWRPISTRRRMAALAVDLTRRGWATWNVEYRRNGLRGGIPATLEDGVAATRCLRSSDLVDGGMPTVVIGHSAGAHLALWVAGDGLVDMVVALGAVTDLVASSGIEVGRADILELMGATPAENPGVYAAADPGSRLPTGTRHLIVHGEDDQRVPVTQSQRYARRVVASGDPCELLVLPGVDHFEPVDPRSGAWAEVVERLESLRGR